MSTEWLRDKEIYSHFGFSHWWRHWWTLGARLPQTGERLSLRLYRSTVERLGDRLYRTTLMNPWKFDCTAALSKRLGFRLTRRSTKFRWLDWTATMASAASDDGAHASLVWHALWLSRGLQVSAYFGTTNIPGYDKIFCSKPMLEVD